MMWYVLHVLYVFARCVCVDMSVYSLCVAACVCMCLYALCMSCMLM